MRMIEYSHKNFQTPTKFGLSNKKALNVFRQNIESLTVKSVRLRKPETSSYIIRTSTRSQCFVTLMAKKMLLVNSAFDTGEGPKLTRADFLKAEWLRATQANGRPGLKNTTNPKVDVVGIITLNIWLDDSRAKVVSGVVRNLAVLILLETSVIDRFVRTSLPPDKRYSLIIPSQYRYSLPKIWQKSERTRMTRHKTRWLQKKNMPHVW